MNNPTVTSPLTIQVWRGSSIIQFTNCKPDRPLLAKLQHCMPRLECSLVPSKLFLPAYALSYFVLINASRHSPTRHACHKAVVAIPKSPVF